MAAKRNDYSREVPEGEDADVWAGACALAIKRHPIAIYPQPRDVEYARVVLGAVKVARRASALLAGPPKRRPMHENLPWADSRVARLSA